MARILLAALAAALVFLAGDLAWITLMGPVLYRPVLGPILAPDVKAAPAVAFYLLYIAGIVLFAIQPWRKDRTTLQAVGWGMLLGLVGYGVYDLTNQATLKVWSTVITLCDMGWGALLSGLAAGAGRRVSALSRHP